VFSSRRIAIFLVILAVCSGGLKATIDYRVRVEVDNFKESVSHQMLVEYKEAKSTFLGQAVITDVKLTPQNSTPIFIDKITLEKVYQFYDPNKLPQQIQASINNIRIPIQESPSPVPMLMFVFGYSEYYLSPKELQGLDYGSFEADMKIQAEFHKDNLHLTAFLDGQKWGFLEIILDLQHVENTTQFDKAIAQAKLEESKVTYTDSGLVNRLLTYLAQRNKKQLSDFKINFIKEIETDVRRTGLGLDDSVFLNFGKFIQTPTAIQIHLKPKFPIAIDRIWYASPQQVGFSLNYLSTKNK